MEELENLTVQYIGKRYPAGVSAMDVCKHVGGNHKWKRSINNILYDRLSKKGLVTMERGTPPRWFATQVCLTILADCGIQTQESVAGQLGTGSASQGWVYEPSSTGQAHLVYASGDHVHNGQARQRTAMAPVNSSVQNGYANAVSRGQATECTTDSGVPHLSGPKVGEIGDSSAPQFVDVGCTGSVLDAQQKTGNVEDGIANSYCTQIATTQEHGRGLEGSPVHMLQTMRLGVTAVHSFQTDSGSLPRVVHSSYQAKIGADCQLGMVEDELGIEIEHGNEGSCVRSIEMTQSAGCFKVISVAQQMLMSTIQLVGMAMQDASPADLQPGELSMGSVPDGTPSDLATTLAAAQHELSKACAKMNSLIESTSQAQTCAVSDGHQHERRGAVPSNVPGNTRHDDGCTGLPATFIRRNEDPTAISGGRDMHSTFEYTDIGHLPSTSSWSQTGSNFARILPQTRFVADGDSFVVSNKGGALGSGLSGGGSAALSPTAKVPYRKLMQSGMRSGSDASLSCQQSLNGQVFAATGQDPGCLTVAGPSDGAKSAPVEAATVNQMQARLKQANLEDQDLGTSLHGQQLAGVAGTAEEPIATQTLQLLQRLPTGQAKTAKQIAKQLSIRPKQVNHVLYNDLAKTGQVEKVKTADDAIPRWRIPVD